MFFVIANGNIKIEIKIGKIQLSPTFEEICKPSANDKLIYFHTLEIRG